jgi:hypothetical protein
LLIEVYEQPRRDSEKEEETVWQAGKELRTLKQTEIRKLDVDVERKSASWF